MCGPTDGQWFISFPRIGRDCDRGLRLAQTIVRAYSGVWGGYRLLSVRKERCMSRYKVTSESPHQEVFFDELKRAKRFIHRGLSNGTAATVRDQDAPSGELAVYTYVAGTDGCVRSGNLPTTPLK